MRLVYGWFELILRRGLKWSIVEEDGVGGGSNWSRELEILTCARARRNVGR